MKSVEEEANTIGSRRMINVTEDVKLVLKTMDLLKANFGVSYVARLVRGDAKYEWRMVHHVELDTYGCLSERHQGFVKNLIYRMMDWQLIAPVEPKCSVMQITPKGREWMAKPDALWVSKTELRDSHLDYKLRYHLQELRRQIGQTENMAVFAIFTEITSDLIVREKPLSYQKLREIPGMDDVRADRYGAAIVGLVRENMEDRMSLLKRNAAFECGSRTYQETKLMFLEGKSIEEIAEVKGIQPRTVVGYLEKLHLAEELDLRAWIEKVVDKKSLHRGAEFFKALTFPTLREAKNSLGLEYDDLRLCRIYNIPSQGRAIAC